MTEKVLSSLHIQKLGHEIREIRERALVNIISKLDHGFTFDNDLARSKEILQKLFEWFLFEPCTKEELVFSLIKRILQSESGKSLIDHNGTIIFKNELRQIRTYIEPKYYPLLDEIVQILNESEVIVPPLETDVPLSHRTTDLSNSTRPVGTTATTIEGLVQQDASAHNNYGLQSVPLCDSPCDIITVLRWQVLIETDRHVLQSIENSLKNPPQPSSLLHSSDFFRNILLHDFPAEVFLQRPTIVLAFQDLIENCPSTRITNSILNCLFNLTKALQVRINHYSDPCMCNSKENVSSRASTPDSSSKRTGSGQSDGEYPYENSDYLKTQQLSFPRYIFSTFKTVFKYLCVQPEAINHNNKRKTNQNGVNLALNLLNELLNLLELVLKDLWIRDSIPQIQDIRRQMNEILIGYGTTVEYFRIEATSDDSNLTNRVTQLCFLHHTANFLIKMVPLSQTGLILPRNLKNALANSLVDVTLAKLYPELYKTLLDYVQSFRVGLDGDSLTKYHETNRICDSMTAAVEFMKNSKALNAPEGVDLAKKALPSLEFHRIETFVKQVMDLAANKLPLYPYDDQILEKFELVILKLLGHNLEEIRQETYRLSQKKVIAAIGPKLNTSAVGVPGAQILFLLRPKILVEIACQGLTSHNSQIRNYSEDILLHIIKCKILVTDEIWNRVVETLIISLPILLCHANKNTSLGRSLFDIIDPDTAETYLFLPKNDVIKGNTLVLFGPDVSMREEAFSRLCWVLASQTDSKNMLPRLNNLYDKALPNVCQIQRVYDINRHRTTQHFYQPSSLQQVLDLLKAPNVEPVIRRSALTQTSVMMEDSILHPTFLEKGGLGVVVSIMKNALIEHNFNDYPDSVVPAINILKNICLFQASARQSLSADMDVCCNILRSLFLFFTEDKLKHDAVCLLFLLIFNDFIRGSPSKADLSVPHLVTQLLHIPISCNTHWEISPYFEESLAGALTSDKCCLSSIQIQWNSEMFGGLDQLLTWNEVDYGDTDIVDILRLKNYDLACLKASSIDYYVRKYLTDIQNGTSHEIVITAITKLATYVHLYKFVPKEDHFLEHPWESTFVRFLKVLPSSEEDAKLLSNVLKFLTFLVPFYKSSDCTLWLSQMLKRPTMCILDLITVEPSSDEEFKTLSQELLALITLCACQEQHFLDYYTYSNTKVPENEISTWNNVIEIITNNLKFDESTHFYNLAYLDSLLACLVHLTASLGWSNTKQRIIRPLVASLCELIVVFHCGKGPTAAVSVMGLSITRHVVLILNHILAEIHISKIKNWESFFMDVEEEEWLKSFLILWSSRDVVLRAAALQFFAGLATSPILAINIVNELKDERQGVWHMALNILIDHDEASVVRENCALLLANFISHTSINQSNKMTVLTSLVPNTLRKGKDDVTTIFELLEDFQFFKNLTVILTALYTNTIIDFDSVNTPNHHYCSNDESSSSKSSRKYASIVTPSFVKNLSTLLLNLLTLNDQQLSYKLQDFGLTKLLFRCIFNPSMSINDTRKLSLYCDILEMDTVICLLLSQVAQISDAGLGTVLHTKDCLTRVISLLNPKIYHTHLPQLIYLRNRLWSEIFKLVSVLTTFGRSERNEHSEEALKIISETIECAGRLPFIQTLCEATKCLAFDDLQNSALLLLSSLLGVESQRIFTVTSSEFSSSSIQSLLDTCRTPESGSADHISQNRVDTSFAGAQICRILLKLYDMCTLKVSKDLVRKKAMITSSLTSILCVSQEAMRCAFDSGLINAIMKQLADFYLKLSLESADSLRKILDKKRVYPVLKELDDFVGLITNFTIGDGIIKSKFAELGLSDLIHKLWVWFALQNLHLINVLKLLCTYTTDCPEACQSLTLTSSVAGSGPKKVGSKITLLHAIIALIEKEMDQVSRTHSLSVLELSFVVLTNCCAVIECRVLFCKCSLLQSVSRLHPAVTKRQKPWDHVELIWLEFLQTFSLYPEGQSSIAKTNDVFDLVLALTSSSKAINKITALLVLRNIAFYQPNRVKLLTSGDFLNLLKTKLELGNMEEKSTVVLIMWSLAANNQKAKIVFKAAQLDVKLQQALKHCQLSNGPIPDDEIERMRYILSIIRDGDKVL